jgi:hypothetical protein
MSWTQYCIKSKSTYPLYNIQFHLQNKPQFVTRGGETTHLRQGGKNNTCFTGQKQNTYLPDHRFGGTLA